MSNLKSTIERLANDFAMKVMIAMRSASLHELMAVGARPGRTGGPGEVARRPERGRLGRRSSDDIKRMIVDIVGLLEKHPEGMRAEQLRQELGCQAKELPRPLAQALSEGLISKSGQKRATTYVAGGKPSGRSSEAGSRRRRGGRRARG